MKWICSLSQSHIDARKVMSSYQGRTLRLKAYNAIQGEKFRVTLSNLYGDSLVVVESVRIIQNNQTANVSFHQHYQVYVEPKQKVVSDEMEVNMDQGDIEIEIDFLKGSKITSGNYNVFKTEISKVDAHHNLVFRNGLGCPIFEQFEVFGEGSALILLGDSLIHQSHWSQHLIDNLRKNKESIAVINHGISGNQWLGDPPLNFEYYGPSISQRFKHDVLNVEGVKYVLLEGGVNDILINPKTDAKELIEAYRTSIEQCHKKGLKVLVMTLPPVSGYDVFEDSMMEKINSVNQWLRNYDEIDQLVDIYDVLNDDGHLKASYDSGDHLHPNAIGDIALAQCFIKSFNGLK